MALCEGFAAMGRNDLAKPYLRANMEASCNDICNGTKSRSQVVMSTLIQMRQVFIQMKNNADELTSAVARYLNLTPSSTPIVRTLCFVTILKCEKKIQNYNKTRTIGVSKSNIEFFNKNILNIEKLLWDIKKIEVFSENLKNKKIIDFENNNQRLFSIIKNYQLINLLLKSLKKDRYFSFK